MIDEKTIIQIAKLAQIQITSEETHLYQEQLAKVLSHFDQIAKINTEGVEPLITPSEIEYFARPDEVIKEFSTEEMLANSPDKSGNLFKVPPVV